MSARRPSIDQLQHVYELNRLFLTFLQLALHDNRDCLDLPAGARDALRSAGSLELDSIAEFPRALFQIVLDEHAGAERINPLKSRLDSMRQSMNLTILLCAWTFSRQSVYQARFLLGLESRAIAALRSLQLTDLQPVPLLSLPELARRE